MKNYLPKVSKLPLMAMMFFLPFSTPTPIQAPTTANACQSLDNEAFQVGEELTYKIYYNLNFVWIPAGEVVFKVTEEKDQYHLSAKGRTYSSYEWFFKVNDNYDTYIDKKTLLPTLSIRDVQEGKMKIYDKITYDQVNKKAYSVRGETKENAKTKKTVNFQDCMHDVVSILYFLRNENYETMQKGQKVPIKIMLDEEIYPLQVKYQGKEVKNVKDNGKYSTLKLQPQVVAGEVFKEGDEMKIWATDDANHLPLMIESPLSVGSVKVVLKGHKGLRYPISSKK